MNLTKYPRTPHLPWSPGGTKDDRRLTDVSMFMGRQLVFTEKMDGSNVCLESKNVFARSHSGPPKHPSFDALKALHATVRRKIPANTQIFGEWLYAQHSIAYRELPHYLMIFGVRTGQQWASWEEVELWAEELGVPTTPVLQPTVATLASARTEDWLSYETPEALEAQVRYFAARKSACGGPREGIVVRPAAAFSDNDFRWVVGKWVRPEHVQTSTHWSHQVVVPNTLKAHS